MNPEWNRKEVKSVSLTSFIAGGVDIDLYGQGKDNGKHSHGWGQNEQKARDNAYKQWDEKYR